MEDALMEEALMEGACLGHARADTRQIELNADIEALVTKIRNTAKLFRKSPVMNEVLQNCIKADLPKKKNGLQLLLDVRTRLVLFIIKFTRSQGKV